MTKRELDKPEFLIGLRGYDREQVDGYIDRLRALVSEAEDRARDAERRYDAAAADAIKLVRATEMQERRRAVEAERRARALEGELERDTHTSIAPRIAQIFELAVEEANDLRGRAEIEADEIRATARGEVEQACVQARRELDETNAKCERGRQQIAQLEAREEVLLTDLRHLQTAMQTVASLINKHQHVPTTPPAPTEPSDPRLATTDEPAPTPVSAQPNEQTPAHNHPPESTAKALAAT
jgi:cell division septum initiation protein DivIVA